MSARRQLVSLGTHCVDFRVGAELSSELPRMLANIVALPRRAALVVEEGVSVDRGVDVSRALIDAGFSVFDVTIPHEGGIATFDRAHELYGAFENQGVTADDLVVGLGGMDLCSLVAFCARTWCGSTSCALLPTTLDAQVRVATGLVGLAAPAGTPAVSVGPGVDLVACDLTCIDMSDAAATGQGRVELALSAFVESKRVWEDFAARAQELMEGSTEVLVDALCMAQTARSGVVKAANPSARRALSFGVHTARALNHLLPRAFEPWRLLAEGMRFEARLAHDVFDLDVEVIFALDDVLDTLGAYELSFTLDSQDFVAALRAERFRTSNRFMLALPKTPGSLRLAHVDEDVLLRHASAYLASRARL